MSNKKIKESIRKLLYDNISEGYSRLLDRHYCYIRPAPKNYPFQFWWDTFFHVIMLCHLKEYDLAKENMRSLFAMQDENGFVGHMIFWGQVFPHRWSDILQAKPTWRQFRPHMSALIQPPLVAQAVLRIYEYTNDKRFLLEMFDKLEKYHRWLSENRDFEKEGLLSIISPFESGIDWKPSFDKVVGFEDGQANFKLFIKTISIDARNFLKRYDLKKIYKQDYFIVKEVMVNTFYALDLQAMDTICSVLNIPSVYKQKANQTSQKILEVMYDKKSCAFFDVYGKKNKKIKVFTPTCFFPLALPQISTDICQDVVKNHVLNPDEFWTPYPLPSVARNEKAFDPQESTYIWRGPVWAIFNWFLFKCLKKRGYTKEAQKLKDTLSVFIEKKGFFEYHNPFTAQGYGAKNFTWSGLLLDMV